MSKCIIFNFNDMKIFKLNESEVKITLGQTIKKVVTYYVGDKLAVTVERMSRFGTDDAQFLTKEGVGKMIGEPHILTDEQAAIIKDMIKNWPQPEVFRQGLMMASMNTRGYIGDKEDVIIVNLNDCSLGWATRSKLMSHVPFFNDTVIAGRAITEVNNIVHLYGE